MEAAPPVAKTVPPDFFEARVQVYKEVPSHTVKMVGESVNTLGDQPTAAVPSLTPAGFFMDKARDSVARGEVIPQQKDIEREFEEFQKSVEIENKEIETKEAEEAEAEALGREEQEDIEQMNRYISLDQLRVSHFE